MYVYLYMYFYGAVKNNEARVSPTYIYTHTYLPPCFPFLLGL